MAVTIRKAYLFLDEGWAVMSVMEMRVSVFKAFAVKAFIELEGEQAFYVTKEAFLEAIPKDHYDLSLGQALYYRAEEDFTDHVSPPRLLAEANHMVVQDAYGLNWRPAIGSYRLGEDAKLLTRRDLVLTSSDRYPVATNRLVLMNGRILETRVKDGKIWGLNAAQQLLKTKRHINSISLINFSSLGQTVFRPFLRGELKGPFKPKQTVTKLGFSGDVSLAGKTVFLVIEGMLVLTLKAVDVVGENTAVVTVPNRLLLKELSRYTATERHSWGKGFLANGGFDTSLIDVKAILENGTSGLLIIDNPDIGLHKLPLGRSSIPGEFTLPIPPSGLLVMDDGMVQDYLIKGYDGDQSSLTVAIDQQPDTIVYTDRGSLTSVSKKQTRRSTPQEGKMVHLYSITT